jgi:hypothetical protein
MVESMALPLNAYDFQVMGIHELSYSELNKADGRWGVVRYPGYGYSSNSSDSSTRHDHVSESLFLVGWLG